MLDHLQLFVPLLVVEVRRLLMILITAFIYDGAVVSIAAGRGLFRLLLSRLVVAVDHLILLVLSGRLLRTNLPSSNLAVRRFIARDGSCCIDVRGGLIWLVVLGSGCLRLRGLLPMPVEAR